MKSFGSIFMSAILCAGLYASSSGLEAQARHDDRHGFRANVRGNQGLHRGWYKNGKAWGNRDWRDNNNWNSWNNNWNNNNWRWNDSRWRNDRDDNRNWYGSRYWNRWY